MKTSKLAFTLIILLFLSITTYQQIQITNLKKLTTNHDEIKSYLMANYGVSSIDELIQKKLEEYGLRYTGNPFTTALYPGQFQSENVTGMHWYTYRGGSLLNRTDTLAFPEQTASYIIFGEDTDNDGVYDIIYAKNCTSGQIEFSDEDPVAVIQAAANALSEGTIFLTQGRYPSSNYPILLPLKVNLQGEGRGATILENTATDGGDTIVLSQASPSEGHQFIRDLQIKGNPNSGSGIYINNVSNVILENIDIKEHGAEGLYVTYSYNNLYISIRCWNNSGTGVYLASANAHTFIQCSISHNNDVGAILAGYCNSIGFYECEFEENLYQAILVGGDSNANTFESNYIYNNPYGIQIEGYEGLKSRNNRITNNLIANCTNFCIIVNHAVKTVIDNNWLYDSENGVWVRANSEDTTIENNYFESIASEKISVEAGGTETHIIRGNKGYVTENGGTATFSISSSVTFAHGLAGTPTGVWCSFNNTDYGSWTWTANNTHITLTVTTANYNGTAYWKAEYKP